jgi:undecaprenyl-diphosphatase
MDLSIYKSINGYAFDHHWFEQVMHFFATDGQYLFVAILAWLFLATGRWRVSNGREGVVAAGFSALIALGIGQLISHAWDRPRPYDAHPDSAHLFVARSHDPSFPSDHATASFAIAVAIFLRNRTAGSIALVLAVLVSVGRVAVGVHYPSDVVGGALLGTACALLLWIPAIREPIRKLAEWVGSIYEGILDRVLRRGSTAPSQPA